MRSRRSNRAAALLAVLIAGCGQAAAPSSPASSPAITSASPTATAATTPVVVGPGETWIAATTQLMIHLIRPDGSGDHVPFSSVPGGGQYHPDWSPDGSRLSFTHRAERDTIWMGNADGSEARLAADCQDPCVYAREAAWSPDGRSLLYSRLVVEDGIGTSTLETVNVETSETSVLVTAPKHFAFSQPRWSPDGHRIVTEYGEYPLDNLDGFPNGVALAIVDLTGREATVEQITDPAALSNSPDWSWATNLLVFARPSSPETDGFDGAYELVTMRPDGTGATAVTVVGPRDGQTPQPAWSPDGSRILFVQPDTTIMAVALDGSAPQPAIATAYGRGLHPRYRPVP